MDVGQSVGNWVVGLIATGGVGALVLLTKHFLGRLTTDVEKVLEKLDDLKEKQLAQEGRLSLGNQAFADLRERVSKTEDRLADLERTLR